MEHILGPIFKVYTTIGIQTAVIERGILTNAFTLASAYFRHIRPVAQGLYG
jgi:hypothetical protein